MSEKDTGKLVATAYPGVFARVNKQGEKSFYIRYRTGGRGSKEIREPVGKASAGMTAAKASRIRAARINGKEDSNHERRRKEDEKKRKAERWTIARLWVAYLEATKESPGRRRTDRSIYSRYLEERFGNKTVEELTTEDIDRLCKYILRKGKKPAMACAVLGLVKRLANFGSRRGLCVKPQTLIFNMPRVDNQKTEVMTDEELIRYEQALLEIEDSYLRAYLQFVAHTGIRRSAAIALRWADIDFDRGFITLRGETAKNKKTAYIPMSQYVRDLLENLGHDNGEFIFPQWSPITYTVKARHVCDKAGLPKDFRPLHGLRHNFASRLASSGKVDLYTLQKLLTHSNPVMTQRYAHLADQAMLKAAAVADDVLTAKK